MATTHQLLQQQAALERRIDEVTSAADPDTNELSADQQAAFDQLWADLQKLQTLKRRSGPS